MPVSPSEAEIRQVAQENKDRQEAMQGLTHWIDQELTKGNRILQLHKDGIQSVYIKWWNLFNVMRDNQRSIYQLYEDAGWNLSLKEFHSKHWFCGEQHYFEITFKAA